MACPGVPREDVLFQLHWQDRSDPSRTEFVAQGGPFRDEGEMQKWLDELWARHGSPPEGCGPMICTDDSEYFVWAASPPEAAPVPVNARCIGERRESYPDRLDLE